jgi:hypothetical protein
LLAAPLAWVLQLFVGYEAVEGGCASGGGAGDVFGLAADSAAAAITVVAGLVAIAGALAAGWVWLAGSEAPGWARFLGFAGVLGSSLLLATILLAGAGIVALDPCSQS